MESIKNFYADNKKNILITLGVIAVIIIIYIIYRMMRKNKEVAPPMPTQPEERQQVTEGMSNQNEQTRVVLFFSPSCHYCQELMSASDSVWNRLIAKFGNLLAQVNVEEQRDIAKNYGVNEYPTILKISGNNVQKYKGDRTFESIDSFIRGVMN